MTRLTDAQCADIAAEQENERIARQLDREQRDSDGNYPEQFRGVREP